ncbi:hypothetical protein RHMOL_Rhmol02G0105600 [Rhododendron molle]|uniref:Uncharacterized protein n=1 Tax=Rhododendron molle TaxID=49168 RepID=A0ACC0PP34_RHOML|nr:hypothetical protein RHMOL_Rhmol02G0105600 [Rhododendron molle]
MFYFSLAIDAPKKDTIFFQRKLSPEILPVISPKPFSQPVFSREPLNRHPPDTSSSLSCRRPLLVNTSGGASNSSRKLDDAMLTTPATAGSASGDLWARSFKSAVDLSQGGVVYLREMVHSALDKPMARWENYCLRQCFVAPEGFSLPKANESAGDSSMDLDISSDQELDAQLDKLRNQLALLGKENSELDKERRAVDRRSLFSNRYAGSVNEALQLYEQHSVHDMFQELAKTASELRKKMEQQKAKKLEQSERIRRERMHIPTGELPTNRSNGLFKAALEELQEFNATIKNV